MLCRALPRLAVALSLPTARGGSMFFSMDAIYFTPPITQKDYTDRPEVDGDLVPRTL